MIQFLVLKHFKILKIFFVSQCCTAIAAVLIFFFSQCCTAIAAVFATINLSLYKGMGKQLLIILNFSTLGSFFLIGIIKKFFSGFLGVCDAPEPLQLGDLGAESMEWLINLHNYVTDDLIIVLAVILIMFLFYFTYTNFTETIPKKDKKFSHSKFLEIFWSILPAFTLLVIVCPIFNLLFVLTVVQNVPVMLEASANIPLSQPLSLLNMEAESPVVDSITDKALIGQAMLFVGASLIFGSGVGIVGPVLVIAGATCMAFGLDIPMDCSGRTSSLNSCSDSDNWDSSMSDTEPFFSDVLKKDKVVKPLVSDVFEKDKVLQPLVAEKKNTNKVAIQLDYIPIGIDHLNAITRNVNLTEFKSSNPEDVARQGEIRSVLIDIVADMKVYNEFGMDMETSKPTDGYYVSNNQLLITEYYPETKTRSDSVVFDGRNPNVLHGTLGNLLAEPIVSPRPRVGLGITSKEVETLTPKLSLVIKSSPVVIEEVVVQSPPVVIEEVVVQSPPVVIEEVVVQSPPVVIEEVVVQSPPVVIEEVVVQSPPVVIEEVVVQSPPVVEELPSVLDVRVAVSPEIASQAAIPGVVTQTSPTVTIQEEVLAKREKLREKFHASQRAAANLRKKK